MTTTTSIQSHVVSPKNYEVIKEINRGGFGVIYLVENKENKQLFAAKVNLQGSTSLTDQDKFISREIGILIRVQAPTILRFSDFHFQISKVIIMLLFSLTTKKTYHLNITLKN